jgi:ribonucleoside-diphosphate reductase alpha chain
MTDRPSDFSKYERPRVLSGYTTIIASGCGKLHVTVNFSGAMPVEVYVQSSTKGGCVANVNCIGRLISRSLQLGVPVDEILDQLHSTRCPTAMAVPDRKIVVSELDDKEIFIKSCPDGIAYAIQIAMSLRGHGEPIVEKTEGKKV